MSRPMKPGTFPLRVRFQRGREVHAGWTGALYIAGAGITACSVQFEPSDKQLPAHVAVTCTKCRRRKAVREVPQTLTVRDKLAALLAAGGAQHPVATAEELLAEHERDVLRATAGLQRQGLDDYRAWRDDAVPWPTELAEWVIDPIDPDKET